MDPEEEEGGFREHRAGELTVLMVALSHKRCLCSSVRKQTFSTVSEKRDLMLVCHLHHHSCTAHTCSKSLLFIFRKFPWMAVMKGKLSIKGKNCFCTRLQIRFVVFCCKVWLWWLTHVREIIFQLLSFLLHKCLRHSGNGTYHRSDLTGAPGVAPWPMWFCWDSVLEGLMSRQKFSGLKSEVNTKKAQSCSSSPPILKGPPLQQKMNVHSQKQLEPQKIVFSQSYLHLTYTGSRAI